MTKRANEIAVCAIAPGFCTGQPPGQFARKGLSQSAASSIRIRETTTSFAEAARPYYFFYLRIFCDVRQGRGSGSGHRFPELIPS